MNHVKELDLIIKGLKKSGFNIYISLPEESDFHKTYTMILEDNLPNPNRYRRNFSIHKEQLKVIFSDDELKAKVLVDIIKDLLEYMRDEGAIVSNEN